MFLAHFISNLGNTVCYTYASLRQTSAHICMAFWPQSPHLSWAQGCSSAWERNKERRRRERQGGSKALSGRMSSLKRTQLERRRDRGSGKEGGGGTVKNGGSQQNRESLIQQPGKKTNMIRLKTYCRQTDGGEYRDRVHESGGNEQMEASARERG